MRAGGHAGEAQGHDRLALRRWPRLLECLNLRVKDISFDRRQLIIRDAKGFRDRVTVLPEALTEALHNHLERVQSLHDTDLRSGRGRVSLPFALGRKYPRAALQ